MARNKKIASLIQGIVGDAPTPVPTSTESGDVSPELVEALAITPEMEEALNAVRKRKVGRPKKNSIPNGGTKEGRATFIVDNDLIRKVKYISLADAKLLKDVIQEALSAYVSKWEEANQVITLPKKK